MHKLLNQEKGFSLTEGMVAQVILSISVLSLLSIFVLGTKLNSESEDVTVATNLAQQKMEEIMNTRFRYIVAENPPGERLFSNEPQVSPYWVQNPDGKWITSLPQGKYEILYPDGLDADPLRIQVRISWLGNNPHFTLSLVTMVSMTPGRFRSY
jgi:type II secretory pathway pseudopilin PulG